MHRRELAIANYRVSSDEQLLNNSLVRQEQSVTKAASELDVDIVRYWSGSVSSKKGLNVDRRDLQEMLDECKRNTKIKYAIFDELDRFMRSMLEIGYFLVQFKQLGVRVVFASQPNLKTDTAADTLLLMLEAFKAEGSNEERQRKSIAGQTTALKEGRYTFNPKPGYMKGDEPGVHKLHPLRAPALRQVLLDIVTKCVTPTQGLINLNRSEFMNGHAPYKMDKFRKIATDPYYAGGISIDKQVKVSNFNGLHEPLITIEQHEELVRIFNGKKKNQKGPRKNGNPKYPVNNSVHCDICEGKQYNRFVGVDITNGKSPMLYEKYRCRSCKRTLTRDQMHEMITQQFRNNPITDEGVKKFAGALEIVWKRREGQNQQEVARLLHKQTALREKIKQQVEAATDPSNASIKEEILASIAGNKEEVEDIESQISQLNRKGEDDFQHFLRYAYGFAADMSEKFLDPNTSKENRERLKQMIFPADFRLDAQKNVYTPEISELIRLVGKKNEPSTCEDSLLVRVKRL